MAARVLLANGFFTFDDVFEDVMTPPASANAKKEILKNPAPHDASQPFGVTLGNLPGSRKLYVDGSERLDGVKVAMSEIIISASAC